MPWRTILDDLTKRGMKKPELALVDGAPRLEKALIALWSDLPSQRCTVHKLRNLIAQAPKKFAEEFAANDANMIYASDAAAVATKRKAFLNKWFVMCDAVAASLEEAGELLFTFKRLPVELWKSARTTSAIEWLHEAFKRRIKTQTVLPSAEKGRRCCAWPCSRLVRSGCARLTVGRHFPRRSTSPPEPIR